jgi:hypothetical protein
MKEEENKYSEGYKIGQRKLAYCILEMTLENVSDYQWLLSHLKEVSEGREIIDNSVIGFRPLEV